MTIPTDDAPPLRSVRLRIGLLAAVYAAFFVAYLYSSLVNADYADWIEAVVLVAVLSLCCMLTFGVALLAPWQRTNWVLTAVMLLLFGATTYEVGAINPVSVGSALLTSLVVATFVPCLPLRLAGFALRKLGSAELAQPSRPPRFTIAQIMGLTTFVAVATTLLLGLWRLRQADAMSIECQILLVYGVYAATFMSIPMLALWGVMSIGPIWWRMILAAGGMTAAILLPFWYMDFDLDWSWLTVTLGLGIGNALPLLVVRSCGYRLVRRSKRRPISASLEATATTQPPAAIEPHDPAP